MTNEKLLHNLKAFDPELWEILRDSHRRQLDTLSLIPTTNAASPFASYLRGSALGNDFLDHHAAEHSSKLERMAVRRACDLFRAEHAIVRIGNPAAASRVVLQALASPKDTILSFNLRKQEHCTGERMQYRFVKFGVEPDTLQLNFGKVRALAHQYNPRLIIYSPVNYPHNIDYEELRKIADEVGAYLWVDLGQNSGLIAAGKIDSPLPCADVATFAASDGLHGPQSGIILSKKRLAEHLEQAVIDSFGRYENPLNRNRILRAAGHMIGRFAKGVLPLVRRYADENFEPPRRLSFALASTIMLYAGARQGKDGRFEVARGRQTETLHDDDHVLEGFSTLAHDMPPESLAYAALADRELWGADLRDVDGLEARVALDIANIQREPGYLPGEG